MNHTHHVNYHAYNRADERFGLFGRPRFGFFPGFGFGRPFGFGFGFPFLTGLATGALLAPRPFYGYPYPYPPYPYPYPCCY